MKKKLLVLTLFVCFATGCSKKDSPDTTPTPSTTAEETQVSMTLEELSKYNGKDGNKAYVAVDGIIYDFTSLDKWKDGEHNGYFAGNDLTEEILNKSPHGDKVLKGLTVVGKLAK